MMAAADLLPTSAAVSAEQAAESTSFVANFANRERGFPPTKTDFAIAVFAVFAVFERY